MKDVRIEYQIDGNVTTVRKHYQDIDYATEAKKDISDALRMLYNHGVIEAYSVEVVEADFD